MVSCPDPRHFDSSRRRQRRPRVGASAGSNPLTALDAGQRRALAARLTDPDQQGGAPDDPGRRGATLAQLLCLVVAAVLVAAVLASLGAVLLIFGLPPLRGMAAAMGAAALIACAIAVWPLARWLDRRPYSCPDPEEETRDG